MELSGGPAVQNTTKSIYSKDSRAAELKAASVAAAAAAATAGISSPQRAHPPPARDGTGGAILVSAVVVNFFGEAVLTYIRTQRGNGLVALGLCVRSGDERIYGIDWIVAVQRCRE